jgi:hypothetical protein
MGGSVGRWARWRKWLGWGLAGVVGLSIVALVGVSLHIGAAVRDARDTAQRMHGGDAVEALIAYVDSPRYALQRRNRAVWALGQLGDARALPVLEKHFTGGPCDHDRELCQRELGKAIEACRGAFNLGALVWRHGSLRP